MFKKDPQKQDSTEDVKDKEIKIDDLKKIDPEFDIKDASLKELVEKNIKWTQIVYNQNKEIKARLTLMAVSSYIKILVIVVPIVLAFIYLPSILEQAFSQYSTLLGGKNISADKILNNVSSSQMQELLKLINR